MPVGAVIGAAGIGAAGALNGVTNQLSSLLGKLTGSSTPYSQLITQSMTPVTSGYSVQAATPFTLGSDFVPSGLTATLF